LSKKGPQAQMIALAGALHPLGRTAASEEAALALISLQENPFIIESILTLDGGWMAQCPGRSLLPPAAGLIHFRFALGEESEDALRTPMMKLPAELLGIFALWSVAPGVSRAGLERSCCSAPEGTV
jgi:hypothetical protein